ncbi:hypothetical protein NCCP133_19440 [Cytobacillus sp. NCCP-133]|nr:hypothetical protein NCCP133_19440 [Cytobacillus sp. NCCP-133]
MDLNRPKGYSNRIKRLNIVFHDHFSFSSKSTNTFGTCQEAFPLATPGPSREAGAAAKLNL